jgi:IclR family pca regulon transcriptional regulator
MRERKASQTASPRSDAPQARSGTLHDRQFIASLAHGLTVLEALADHGRDMSLSELAQTVNQAKPTAWRLVHTLVELGYVRQDPLTRRFALSPRILALGACFESMELKDLAAPYLRDLSARVGETVNMAVLDDDMLIYVERIKTQQVININLHVGSRLPLYNTSMGRALVAEMPEEWLRAYIGRIQHQPEAAKYVQNGGRYLFQILRETRAQGYALNDEELVSGLRSAATPVRASGGRIVAAINISVPSVRVSARTLKGSYVPELVKTAREISRALGYPGARRSVATGDVA